MFSDQEKDAFRQINSCETYKLYSEFFFYLQLDEDPIRLGIKIYEMDTEKFYSVQSHHLHTPIQAGPYHTSRAIQDTAEEALRNGLECMTCYIEDAIKKGHSSTPGWFVKNESY